MRIVSAEEARHIAVRAQLLDGSAKNLLDTVRRLGFLQIDPISTVTPPQYLVPWSRLGPYDPAELDRLLWKQKKLFEWNAYVRPIEDLPIVQARIRRRNTYAWERRGTEFLQQNARYKRFVLKELERRGPLLSRELDDDSIRTWKSHGWHGNRNTAVMLDILHGRGVALAIRGAAGWPAALGSCGTLVSGDREGLCAKPSGGSPRCGSVCSRVRQTLAGWEAHPDVGADPFPIA